MHSAELVGDTCLFQRESSSHVGSSVGTGAEWAELTLRAGTGALLSVLLLTRSTAFDSAQNLTVDRLFSFFFFFFSRNLF